MTQRSARHRIGVREMLLSEIGAALKQLRRSPGVSTVIVATFALGIGMNATLFGIIDRLVLRPPPHVVDPAGIVKVAVASKSQDGTTNTLSSFPYVAQTVFRDRVPALADAAVSGYSIMTLGRGERAQRVRALLTSASYFSLTGVHPAIGRFFSPDEDRPPSGIPVVVLSYGFWQREFGTDRGVLGKTLDINGGRYTIVGVTPRGFGPLDRLQVDMYLPVSAAAPGLPFLSAFPNWATTVNLTWFSMYARVRPGATIRQAEAQASSVVRDVTNPGLWDSGEHIVMHSILDRTAGVGATYLTASLLLAGMCLLVLLITCSNVASLLLGRALQRRREVAVRIALGVSRGQLIMQLLTESTLLALAGGAAALVVVQWSNALLNALAFQKTPVPIDLQGSVVDPRVLAFTAVLTLATGLLSGLVPALQGSSPDVARALKEGAREGSAHRSRARTALVVLQTVLAMITLVATGLFVRSMFNLSAVDLGMEPNRVLVATMDLPSTVFDSNSARAFVLQAEERVRQLPGIGSVSTGSELPLTLSTSTMNFTIPGRDSASLKAGPYPPLQMVTPGFFTTLGIRILRGRGFAENDRRPGANVTVVSASMARRYWPDADPIGQCIVFPGQTCTQIVGVAADVRQSPLDKEGMAEYYLPTPLTSPNQLILFARPVDGHPKKWIEPVRRTLQGIRTDLPYADVFPMTKLLDSTLGPLQLGAGIFAMFGGLALVLAAVGLYGVIAYTVSQRFHEIGVRIALGAQSSAILRLIMWYGLKIAAMGAGIGLAVVLLVGRFIQPMLFHVPPRDPVVLTSVIALLCGVAVLASFVPARRGTRLDPTVALRQE